MSMSSGGLTRTSPWKAHADIKCTYYMRYVAAEKFFLCRILYCEKTKNDAIFENRLLCRLDFYLWAQ